MKAKFYLLMFFTFFYSLSFAQITFERTFGSATLDEKGKCVKQTPDGGYIVGGTELTKLTEAGVVEWTKDYPCEYVNTTSDSGYILIRSTGNIYFTKLDKLGDTIWTSYYTQGHWAREGFSIEQTNDGGYIVSGRFQSVTGSGMMLLKLNSLGAPTFRKTFWESTSAAFAYGLDVHQTADNGFIMAGFTYIDYYDSNRHKDVYVVKTDSVGNLEWQKNIGDSTRDEIGREIKETVDGSYIIAGSQYDANSGVTNRYLVKINAQGNTLWIKQFGTTDSSAFRSVFETNDFGYILTGHSNISTNGGASDLEVWKLDSAGNISWTKTFGGSDNDLGNRIEQTTDNGYILCGSTKSYGAGLEDTYVIKIDSNGNLLTPLSTMQLQLDSKEIIYPNPTDGVFCIKGTKNEKVNYYLYDIQGRKLKELRSDNNVFNISELPSGIYYLKEKNNYQFYKVIRQ